MFPVSFTDQIFRLQIPLRPCITHRKFCFPSPVAPASERRQIPLCKVVVFCPLVPISCSEQCSDTPSPEYSWSCWSHSREKPSTFPEQGWIRPLLLWDKERCTWRRSVTGSPSWKAHLACQWAPFLGAAAAKRRQIRKTEVQILLVFLRNDWLSLQE